MKSRHGLAIAAADAARVNGPCPGGQRNHDGHWCGDALMSRCGVMPLRLYDVDEDSVF